MNASPKQTVYTGVLCFIYMRTHTYVYMYIDAFLGSTPVPPSSFRIWPKVADWDAWSTQVAQWRGVRAWSLAKMQMAMDVNWDPLSGQGLPKKTSWLLPYTALKARHSNLNWVYIWKTRTSSTLWIYKIDTRTWSHRALPQWQWIFICASARSSSGRRVKSMLNLEEPKGLFLPVPFLLLFSTLKRKKRAPSIGSSFLREMSQLNGGCPDFDISFFINITQDTWIEESCK